MSNCADARVPQRDDDVLDGPKGTVLQITSNLSIHDACVVELKRSLGSLTRRSLEKLAKVFKARPNSQVMLV